MLFVSASAQAISISGQAGEDYTNIGGFWYGIDGTGAKRQLDAQR